MAVISIHTTMSVYGFHSFAPFTLGTNMLLVLLPLLPNSTMINFDKRLECRLPSSSPSPSSPILLAAAATIAATTITTAATTTYRKGVTLTYFGGQNVKKKKLSGGVRM